MSSQALKNAGVTEVVLAINYQPQVNVVHHPNRAFSAPSIFANMLPTCLGLLFAHTQYTDAAVHFGDN